MMDNAQSVIGMVEKKCLTNETFVETVADGIDADNLKIFLFVFFVELVVRFISGLDGFVPEQNGIWSIELYISESVNVTARTILVR